MVVQKQNPDGSWSNAEPIGPQGWRAKTENWLLGFHSYPLRWVTLPLAQFLGRWDERGLGR